MVDTAMFLAITPIFLYFSTLFSKLLCRVYVLA